MGGPGEYIHGHCHGALCKDLEDWSWIGAKRAIMCADCAYAYQPRIFTHQIF